MKSSIPAAQRPQAARSLRLSSLSVAIGVVFAAAALSGTSLIAAADPVAASANVKEKARPSQPATSDRIRYTIQLRGEALAGYEGGVAGFAKPPRVTQGRSAGLLDVHSAAAVAYVDYLAQRQTALVSAIESRLGRSVDVVDKLQYALNAVIVELTDSEAQQIANLPDVVGIEREQELELLTDRGPAFIGAPGIWDGTASDGIATKGEGMVVAILDTGINWQSPAFAATGPIDGYIHVNPNGAGTYVGLCGTTPPNADLGRCNEKLIGMFDFTSTSASRSATDLDGHGSHTASTVAGNAWNAPFGGGTFLISGVAPHANVVAYRVCTSGCSSSASASSVNSAISLGYVKALNYSISGGTSPWSDTVSTAFRNAVNAGIFVAASAGNDGPTLGTVNHVEPWVETVAASTKDNVVAFRFNLTGPGVPPANTQGLPLRPAAPPFPTGDIVDAPIVQSPGFANGNSDGCTAYPADTFKVLPMLPGAAADTIYGDSFDIERSKVGAVAVLNLDQNNSGCASGARRTAALTAGAIGVIFVDPFFINLGAADTSWSMLRSDWDKAWAHIQANPAMGRASLLFPASSFPQRGNVLIDFSSRGPRVTHSGSSQWIIKPDITAPGVDILAAYMAGAGGATATAIENGTSMSSPHMAGAGALMRAVRPTWTVTQIRSALNLTARLTDLITGTTAVPVTPQDSGSGHVDLTVATRTGLLLDETNANFSATPTGSSLSNLNLAQLARFNCTASCTFTRTFTNALTVSQDYTLSITGLPAGAVVVSPTSFTIPPGGTQTITVTGTSALLTAAVWNYGVLWLDPTDTTRPRLHLPIALRP